jgi:hypothetical protein
MASYVIIMTVDLVTVWSGLLQGTVTVPLQRLRKITRVADSRTRYILSWSREDVLAVKQRASMFPVTFEFNSVAAQSKAKVCGRLDAGFESRWRHRCWCLVFICCVVLCR